MLQLLIFPVLLHLEAVSTASVGKVLNVKSDVTFWNNATATENEETWDAGVIIYTYKSLLSQHLLSFDVHFVNSWLKLRKNLVKLQFHGPNRNPHQELSMLLMMQVLLLVLMFTFLIPKEKMCKMTSLKILMLHPSLTGTF